MIQGQNPLLTQYLSTLLLHLELQCLNLLSIPLSRKLLVRCCLAVALRRHVPRRTVNVDSKYLKRLFTKFIKSVRKAMTRKS